MVPEGFQRGFSPDFFFLAIGLRLVRTDATSVAVAGLPVDSQKVLDRSLETWNWEVTIPEREGSRERLHDRDQGCTTG